jgi:DNA-binding transcriptional regulator YiaG
MCFADRMSVIPLLANRELKALCRTGRAREIREAADVSLSALARQLGVSKSLLWSWENGRGMPNAAHAETYSAALMELANYPEVGSAAVGATSG